MLLELTDVRGAYKIVKSGDRVPAYVVSSESGREVLCDSMAVGRAFQRKIGSAVRHALRALLEIDHAFAVEFSSAPPSVLNILRGGLNFEAQDACEEVAGRPVAVSFMTSERTVQDGHAVVSSDEYRRFDFSANSVLVVGDISATGSTIVNALRHILKSQPEPVRPRNVVVVTVGTVAALETINKFCESIQRSESKLADVKIRVVFLEGAFGLYHQRLALPEHLDGTDFIRAGGLVTPEFMLQSLRQPISLLERCVVYDGGVRGFSPRTHLVSLLKYWKESVVFSGDSIAVLQEHLEKKTGVDLFADSPPAVSAWRGLPGSSVQEVYTAATDLKSVKMLMAIVDLSSNRADDVGRQLVTLGKGDK